MAALAFVACPRSAPGQMLYVSDQVAGTISEYDAQTGVVVGNPFISNARFSVDLSIAANTLYSADTAPSTPPVIAYDATTGAKETGFGIYTLGNGMSTVSNIAVSRGVLYASANSFFTTGPSGTVNAYNATTGAVLPGFHLSNLSNVSGVAVLGNTLYVATGGMINTYYAPRGDRLSTGLVSVGGASAFLTIAGSTLYVAVRGTRVIRAFDALTGQALPDFTTVNTATDPKALAIVGNDLLVASDNSTGGMVSEYDATTGALINANFITGLSDASALAVLDVPEPSSWAALIVGGAGLLGFGLRRRA